MTVTTDRARAADAVRGVLTVTLNAALDVTYEVDVLRPGGSHRVNAVRSRAGGKGVNVARVLGALGEPAVVTGLAGGAAGAAIRADLAASGLVDELVGIAGESRRTVNVVAEGDATIFNEPGAPVTDAEWREFRDRFAELVARARLVVLAGSLPPTVPRDAYATLAGDAHAAGTPVLVDADGEPMRAALAARPDVVTPNAAELRAVTGLDDPVRASAWLRDAGATAVVATLGADGVLATVGGDVWRARPATTVTGNPTGAGDACAAALAAGTVASSPWRERVRDAVALSSAAVVMPLAGEVDLDSYRRFRTAVTVEEVSASRADR